MPFSLRNVLEHRLPVAVRGAVFLAVAATSAGCAPGHAERLPRAAEPIATAEIAANTAAPDLPSPAAANSPAVQAETQVVPVVAEREAQVAQAVPAVASDHPSSIRRQALPDIDEEFLTTRVTAGPLLQVLATDRLGDLSELPGLHVQAGVRRPSWREPVDLLWLDWSFASTSATTGSGQDQRLQVQTYRGGVDLRWTSEPWVPTLAMSVGVLDLRLREGDATDRTTTWLVGGDAVWSRPIDRTWHLLGSVGTTVGPKVTLFDQSFSSLAFTFRIGVGYAY